MNKKNHFLFSIFKLQYILDNFKQQDLYFAYLTVCLLRLNLIKYHSKIITNSSF